MSNLISEDTEPSPLQKIVERVKALYEQRRYETCLDYLAENIVEVWFGFEPQLLAQMLQNIISSGVEISIEGRMTLQYLTSTQLEDLTARAPQEPAKFSQTSFDLITKLGQMIQFRQRGMVVEASSLADELSQLTSSIPFFYDPSRGMNQLVLVQCGISAMLAGEFELALRNFTEANLYRMQPALPFLTRDAYVKAALIHAAFGDFGESKVLLNQAAEVQRTHSWVEATIDASESLARAILSIANRDSRDATFPDVSLQDVGEMWPFYVIALQRVFERKGERTELLQRLQQLQRIRFPRIDGEGFAGSVLPLAIAAAQITRGDIQQARQSLSFADPNYVGTGVMQMIYDASSGNLERVLAVSNQIRGQVVSLRQLNLFRLSLTVSAHVRRGERDDAVALLRTLVDFKSELTPMELAFFPREIQELAASEISGWPTSEPIHSNYISELRVSRADLTPRETEILRMLASGSTRAQIAEETFVSLNTVKTHLQALYRKLGVASGPDAVAEGLRRGLI